MPAPADPKRAAKAPAKTAASSAEAPVAVVAAVVTAKVSAAPSPIEEDEEDLDTEDEEESSDDEDEDDESFVTNSSEEEDSLARGAKHDLKLSQINDSNPLFTAGASEFDSEYARQSAALEAARDSNRITGGQYLFQQKLLDLEFREIHHLRELQGGARK